MMTDLGDKTRGLATALSFGSVKVVLSNVDLDSTGGQLLTRTKNI
jgi:hypothetical protein